jgi:hypothetical protein
MLFSHRACGDRMREAEERETCGTAFCTVAAWYSSHVPFTLPCPPSPRRGQWYRRQPPQTPNPPLADGGFHLSRALPAPTALPPHPSWLPRLSLLPSFFSRAITHTGTHARAHTGLREPVATRPRQMPFARQSNASDSATCDTTAAFDLWIFSKMIERLAV